MRVGINTLMVDPTQTGGVCTYLQELTRHLVLRADHIRYVLFVARWNRHLFPPESSRVEHVVCPVPSAYSAGRVAYEQGVLPGLALAKRLNVFHSPSTVM